MLKLLILLGGFIGCINALSNGLALTPPMGWLAWERFRCVTDCDQYPDDCVSEKLFKDMADRVAEDGYADAGYEYIIMDDCWLATERDANGNLQPDPKRFPSGIKALADYVHSKNLKFGVYEDYGTHTCAGYPGLYGHLENDANTFAEWGADYIKVDGCYADPKEMPDGFAELGKYLNQTGRPMVYSCLYPLYDESNTDYSKVAEHCNLWRNYGDIDDSWNTVLSITKFYSQNYNRFGVINGPGQWNDPDMLIVGDFGLSPDEAKAQMAMWSMLAVPLLMSADLRTIKPEFRDILINKDVIAINQDKDGVQAPMVYTKDNVFVFTKPMATGESAVAFLNTRTDGTPYKCNVNFQDIKLSNANGYNFKDVYDKNASVIYDDNSVTVHVNPSGVVLLMATPK